jgi:hypothetical protein
MYIMYSQGSATVSDMGELRSWGGELGVHSDFGRWH